MSTPSPFDIGRATGKSVSKAFQGYQESRMLDDILDQYRGGQVTPTQNLDIMGQVLRNFSPETRGDVLSHLKDRFALSREQGLIDDYLAQGGNLASGSQARSSPQVARAAQQQLDAQDTFDQTPPTQFASQIQERPSTPEAIDERARELMRSQPVRFRDPDTARQAALDEIAGQQSTLTNTKRSFDDYVKRAIEKEGKEAYGDLTGDMQNRFIAEATQEALQGKKTPEKIAQEKAQELLDFAKARTNLRATSSIPLLTGKLSPKQGRERLDAARKIYKEMGDLELFENDLVSPLGLSSPAAASVAYPVSQNSAINSYLKDSKNIASWNPFAFSKGGQFFGGIQKKGKGRQKRSVSQIASHIADHLQPEDSLLSIAAAFNTRGYDGQKIMSELQKASNQGTLALTKRQERDFQKRASFGATLQDLAYFSGLGYEVDDL